MRDRQELVKVTRWPHPYGSRPYLNMRKTGTKYPPLGKDYVRQAVRAPAK